MRAGHHFAVAVVAVAVADILFTGGYCPVVVVVVAFATVVAVVVVAAVVVVVDRCFVGRIIRW